MSHLLALSRGIDRVAGAIGVLIGWLTLIMILIGAFNAIARSLDARQMFETQLSSNAFIELQWYLFSLVFLLGGCYALRHNVHVRVDVLYGRLSARAKAYVDIVGTLLFLLPFTVFVLWMSVPAVENSWAVRELSPDPGGLPRYPIKTAILVAFGLLLLQALSELIKRIGFLAGKLDTLTGDRAAENDHSDAGAQEASR